MYRLRRRSNILKVLHRWLRGNMIASVQEIARLLITDVVSDRAFCFTNDDPQLYIDDGCRWDEDSGPVREVKTTTLDSESTNLLHA